MKFLLVIVLLATVGLAQGAPTEQVDADQCLKLAESKFVSMTVPAEVDQLLDVLRAAHPNVELMEIDKVSDEAKDKLKELGYPEACDEFLNDFSKLDDELACMNQVESKLMAKNERVNLLVAASSVCDLAQLLEE